VGQGIDLFLLPSLEKISGYKGVAQGSVVIVEGLGGSGGYDAHVIKFHRSMCIHIHINAYIVLDCIDISLQSLC
jgi:urocanate hydratase